MIGWGVALILYVLGTAVMFALIDSGMKLAEIDPHPVLMKMLCSFCWPLLAFASLIFVYRKRKRRKQSDDMSGL